MPEDLDYSDAAACGSVRAGARWTSVGLYVPGGTAAYPSSVLMNAVPAKVAGVERIVDDGAGARRRPQSAGAGGGGLAGVTEIYRVGGAQAIAALAYGTRTIAPVDKIVGPGNAYVAAAKRQVFGTVGIDMIAGPSEILVVADGDNDPAWIAADLLSQAEHDAAAQSILITDDRGFARARGGGGRGQLETLPRARIARASWETHGAVIVVRRSTRRAALVDRIAPEHLELAVAEPEPLVAQDRECRRHLPRPHTPEAIGDYVAGPTMCCRRRAARAFPRASACSIS